MPVYIGNQKIKEFYIGSTKLKELWLGSTKIWQHAAEGPLYYCYIGERAELFYVKHDETSAGSLLYEPKVPGERAYTSDDLIKGVLVLEQFDLDWINYSYRAMVHTATRHTEYDLYT